MTALPLAIFTDVHSNLHALKAVLAECQRRGITRYACLGDIVGYGAFPRECLKTIRALRGSVVIGNHDYYVAHESPGEDLNEFARAGVEYSIQELNAAEKEWLAARPQMIVKRNYTLVHASLEMPGEWEYILTAGMARGCLELQTTPVCFYGHTHLPKMYAEEGKELPQEEQEGVYQLARDGKVLINPGAVGQPRGGDPRAHFAVFYPETLRVEFVKTEYDVHAAARAIVEVGLPSYLGERLLEGV